MPRSEDALRTGNVDLISTSDGSNINSFDGDGDYRPELYAQYGETSYVMFHLTQPGLDDRRVRCALQPGGRQAGPDRHDLRGWPRPRQRTLLPGPGGYLADNGSLPYDPEAARALVDDYIAETGQTPRIVYSTTTGSNNLLLASSSSTLGGHRGRGRDRPDRAVRVHHQRARPAARTPGAFGMARHNGVKADDPEPSGGAGRRAVPDGQLSLNFGRLDDPVINETARPVQAAEIRSWTVRRQLRRGDQPSSSPTSKLILPLWFTKLGA